jgi:hypothetical protein
MNFPTAIQPLRQPAARRLVLLTVCGARSLLGCNEDRILDLVESGELSHAWELSLLGPKRCQRKELRILPESVAAFNNARRYDPPWREVLSALFPNRGDVLTAPEVALVLNASSTHVLHLIGRGELKAACSTWKRGPGGARIVTSSLEEFLARRKYPIPEI